MIWTFAGTLLVLPPVLNLPGPDSEAHCAADLMVPDT